MVFIKKYLKNQSNCHCGKCCFVHFTIRRRLEWLQRLNLAKGPQEVGHEGFGKRFLGNQAGVRYQLRSLERIILWATDAATADPMADGHTRVWSGLLEDWQTKKQRIARLERDIAGVIALTPYILLLSHPGINVVSAAELAGEMGPIENYASAKAVSGRAGLFPSRYQSDQVDRGGKLSRFRNARLRRAWMMIADNMVKCNAYWRAKAAAWKTQGVEPRDLRCRIANRLTRIVFAMISGRQLYRHPSRLDRGYVMDKLLSFHREHQTPPHITARDLQRAAEQIPTADRAEEAKPLQDVYQKNRRRRGPQPIGDLLVEVLAKLGVEDLSTERLESK